ncbi:uncharacterized protein LOC108911918 [Anoplophora glabripennis]|uniref:uncharacterized protein LOC108911918 n=1 Tax=Anoplophora glabripennis TaxID=217634 RepID=UPI0008754115|nr:uncharacterized protein LOC108911918 [Anoplophora glabripennis]
MVRSYKRKTLRADIDEAVVTRALTEILNGRMSIRAAAAEFGLKKSMLHKRFKKQHDAGDDSDETGITTVLPSPKVITEKGKKQVGQIVSSERGQLVTFTGIITATGNALPPVYVFPRVHAKDHFVNGGPVGAVGLAHKSGWMTAELFMDVLKHIVHHVLPTKEIPVLLFIDNHKSHISLPALCFCKENGIVVLSFPPHCSHKLQPLDVGVYGPFKAMLKSAFNNHMATHPGKQISIYVIPLLSKQPFLASFVPKNIIKAFEACGLWPLNDHIFTEVDFQSSYVTDISVMHELDQNITSENITTLEDSSVSNQFDSDIAGPSGIVTPEVIRPFPKAAPRQNINRRKGKSCIYTSTPEIDAIKSKEIKIPKEQKKNVKRVIMDSSSEQEQTESSEAS